MYPHPDRVGIPHTFTWSILGENLQRLPHRPARHIARAKVTDPREVLSLVRFAKVLTEQELSWLLELFAAVCSQIESKETIKE
jgi:hypothetical protein